MPKTISAEEQEILLSVRIPPRPQVLLKIAAEFRKELPDVGKIASFIIEDMAISGAVLQVINSAAYRRVSDVESIERAVTLLGLDRIYPLVKAVALKATMSVSDELTSFWQQQTDIAQACISAARLLGKPELADKAYMLGLFHFSGVPVLYQAHDDYREFMRRADRQGWDNLADEEKDQYRTSHASVGCVFAHKWALPREMSHVIYNLHDVYDVYESNQLSESALDYLTILKMARTAVICKNGKFPEFSEWANVSGQVLNHYGLDESDMNDRMSDLQANLT